MTTRVDGIDNGTPSGMNEWIIHGQGRKARGLEVLIVPGSPRRFCQSTEDPWVVEVCPQKDGMRDDLASADSTDGTKCFSASRNDGREKMVV